MIFARFDSFVDRLNIIKEFFRTAQQFLKLEKVEIGGLRGKALSNRIICVHEEFKVRSSVTRLGDLLDFGQLLKAFGNN